jgi:SAM-dependent methyltransferase
MSDPHDYVIEGGRPGRERLRLLSTVLAPTTNHFLDRVGVAAGMRCLDVGCGGGDVTWELARRVGRSGLVVGLDFDEQVLALAREDADAEGLANVTFRQLDAMGLHDGAEFDVVYARFLLTHLPDWRRGLRRMIAATRPGGRIAIEDIDFTGHICHPECPAFRRYVVLYQEAVMRHGADPNIGPKLAEAMIDQGVRDVSVDVVQPVFLSGDGKRIAAVTMERIAARAIEADLATAAEVRQIVGELEEFARDSRTLLSLPRIFQVSGRSGPSDGPTSATAARP